MSILFCLLLISVSSSAQERRIFNIPDIPGYQTLLCDFHMHTVFSDGQVWPTVRVDEAWRHDLDAIAITDHLEYQPHRKDMNADLNRSWQMAKKYAEGKDVIVIPGTEITKSMPPGHLNALFIKDAIPIYNENYNTSIEEAANQGAFIMWNHPGWKRQQPDTMKWWTEHTHLLRQGWLHGIELINGDEFYPEAVNWALDSGLTIIGSSDMHAPFLENDLHDGNHRSITLVFATEKSEGGIRDALFSGRTAAYCGHKIIGKYSLLEALFLQSIRLTESGLKQPVYSFINNTDLHFDLLLKDQLFDDWSKQITLKPGCETILIIPEETEFSNVRVHVQNFIVGTGKELSMPLSRISHVNK